MMVATSAGVQVLVPRKHLKQHLDVIPLLDEAIQKVEFKGQGFIATEVDMGRIVGRTFCVPTDIHDEIRFAQRVGRCTITRFVVGKEPIPSSKVTILLRRSGNNHYRVVSSWIGALAEKEPSDPTIGSTAEYEKSKRFWDKHALVWGTQEVVK